MVRTAFLNSQFFPFMDRTLDMVSRKPSPNPRSPRFSPVLSSRSLTCSAPILFELSFAKGVRSVTRFFFIFAYGCSVVPVPIVENRLGSLMSPWLLCQRAVDSIYVGLFCSIDHFCLLLPILQGLDYCSFTVSLEVPLLQLHSFPLILC